MGLLNDTSTYSPGAVSGLSYNNFTPASSTFPAVGGSYTDPVFGENITRLTSSSSLEDIYTFHYANCDGTRCFAQVNGTDFDIISLPDCTIFKTGQPDGGATRTDCRWDMVNPDVYYFYTSSAIVARNVVSGTNTTTNVFPTVIQGNGGTQNTQSSDGRYFFVRYGSAGHVWDSQNDTIYTGNVPIPDGTGYMGITPNAAYVWGASYNTNEVHSFAINHATSTVATTGVVFWKTPGDHGSCISASDGKSYMLTADQIDVNIIAIEMGVDRSAFTDAQLSADSIVFFPYNEAQESFHATGFSNGSLQDWGAVSINSGDDGTGGSETFGRAYMQEVIAINPITGDFYRLAHHRCQVIVGSSEPRVSSSADGSVIMWWSNFNLTPAGTNGKLYAIFNPLDEFLGGEGGVLRETIVTFGGNRVTVRIT